jgi:hypothetical protein
MMHGLLAAWMRFAETLVNYTLGAVLIALFLAVCYTAYTPRVGRTWRIAGPSGTPQRSEDEPTDSRTG